MPPRVQLHQHDAIVVGGGGAGLTAAVYLARQNGLRTAVVSKLHPVRSHTGAAQGGIGAALGNVDPEGDSWEWHMFDTVKGSDYLADQNAVEILTREAIELIYELEHMGPAAIVQAHRFIFDSRDRGAAERLSRLSGRHGVWGCRTVFNCTKACPRDIKVTQAIAEVKQAVILGGE